MEHRDKFQGVICCCMNDEQTVKETIFKILDLKDATRMEEPLECYNLELKNKYYQATIQMVDYSNISFKDESIKLDILKDCHAIILYVCDQKIATEQLDIKVNELSDVDGEPRILLYDGVDEDDSLRNWSIANGYDLIDATDEAIPNLLIDSLSAYRWPHKLDKNENKTDKPKLNDDLMQKLADFDNLLGKLSAYRDKPELRGNPDDKNIVEIADLLSGLLGDDVDDFLDAGEGSSDNKSNSTTSTTTT